MSENSQLFDLEEAMKEVNQTIASTFDQLKPAFIQTIQSTIKQSMTTLIQEIKVLVESALHNGVPQTSKFKTGKFNTISNRDFYFYLNERKHAYFKHIKCLAISTIYSEHLEFSDISIPKKFLPHVHVYESGINVESKRALAIAKTKIEISRIESSSHQHKTLYENIDKEVNDLLSKIEDDAERITVTKKWADCIKKEEVVSTSICAKQKDFFGSERHMASLNTPITSRTIPKDSNSHFSSQIVPTRKPYNSNIYDNKLHRKPYNSYTNDSRNNYTDREYINTRHNHYSKVPPQVFMHRPPHTSYANATRTHSEHQDFQYQRWQIRKMKHQKRQSHDPMDI